MKEKNILYVTMAEDLDAGSLAGGVTTASNRGAAWADTACAT